MIGVLLQVPRYKLFRATGRPRQLPLSMTVSVTYNCNSRCKTCNIWKKKADDLSLEEFDSIFNSLGKTPYWFTISGGEPFLRDDIVQLCQSIYRNCKPGVINIATNGLLTGIIPVKVRQIAESCPHTHIIVNLSLDGVGTQHDNIRGVPGGWDKAMKTYAALRELRYTNLELGIHSVVSNYNIHNVSETYEYVMRELKPDSYITEIAEERVELDNIGAGITPAPEAYGEVIDWLALQLRERRFKGISRITQTFRLRYYESVKKVLVEKRQVIPCYAGFAAAHILPDGEVWACCIKGQSMGNLRQANYDFRKVWLSQQAEKVRQGVKKDGCFCPVANISYINMLCHFPTLLKVGWGVMTS